MEGCICPLGNSEKPYLATASCENNIYQHQNQAPEVATPWTAAYQAPLSMGFSRQKYWSGVPLPSPNKHGTYVICLECLAFSARTHYLTARLRHAPLLLSWL